MLLLPLLIVGFGICATESKNVSDPKVPTNRTLINGARKFLRSPKEIRLLMFSSSVQGKIPTCIRSKFLSDGGAEGGVRRTLEADGEITRDFGKPLKLGILRTTKPPLMQNISIKANVTVYVGQVYQSLQVVADEDNTATVLGDGSMDSSRCRAEMHHFSSWILQRRPQ
uniref:Putative secreted protein 94 n=1 Tax=Amblyomma triste TaxID=251400 RepID=A0A023G1D1_AMBTT